MVSRMSRSILQDKKEGRCYICEHRQQEPRPPKMTTDIFGNQKAYLEEHHVFGGPNRKASEKYGLKVYLCKYHHTGDISGSSEAVHQNREIDMWLKKRAQYAWERKYAKHLHESEEANEEFRDVFGKSYL